MYVEENHSKNRVVQLFFRLKATLNLCPIYLKLIVHASNSMASAHVIFKYVYQTNDKGGCQSGRKVVPHDSKSDFLLGVEKRGI